jgi:hypothetical protein
VERNIVTSASQHRSPYQGLIPYEVDDARFFFGREKETRLIAANLFGAPLTLLYGASGVGKSSVLRAGVIDHLRPRDDMLVIEFHDWQSDALRDLKIAIAKAAARANGQGLTPTDSVSLAKYLAACTVQLDRRLMVILDQFEEYFLYHPQNDVFAEEFPRAVMQDDAPVSFLISIREDSLAKLDRFEGRIPTLFDNYLRIEYLNHEAAEAAIKKPIKQYNRLRTVDREAADREQVIIKSELVEAVLEQLVTGQVILGEVGRGVVKGQATEAQIETPYLRLVMTRLWDEEMAAHSHTLRLETLNRLGGAERIVKTHLDAVMNTLPAHEQDMAARVFHYLVTPSGTKIAHTSRDLADYARLPKKQLTPMLEKLSDEDRRILRPVAPPPDQQAKRYEIFHDVLAPAILGWRTRYMEAQRFNRLEYLVPISIATAVFGALLGALFTALVRMVPGSFGLTLTQYIETKADNLFQGFFQGGVGGFIWGGFTAGFMALGWILLRREGQRLISGWNTRDVILGALGGLVGGIGTVACVFLVYEIPNLRAINWLPQDSEYRNLGKCLWETGYCGIYPILGTFFGVGIALGISALHWLPRSAPCWNRFIAPHVKEGRIVGWSTTLWRVLCLSALFSIPTAALLYGTAIALMFWLNLDFGRTMGEVTSIVVGAVGTIAGIMLGQLIMHVGISLQPQVD